MKKAVSFIIAASIVTGCKSFDPRLLNPTGTSFNPKLPAMEFYVESSLVYVIDANGSSIGASSQDINTYFEREVDELITNPYGDKKGSITLKITNIETRAAGLGFLELDAFTLFIPSLFGMPVWGATSTVEVEIMVNNSHSQLLGKYRGMGAEKFYGSFYNGKLYRDGVRVAYLDAVKIAVNDAKAKMATDLGRLNDALSRQ